MNKPVECISGNESQKPENDEYNSDSVEHINKVSK